MTYAFFMMNSTRKKNYYNSYAYAKAKEEMIRLMCSEETREKCRQANLGEKNPMFGMTGDKNPFYGRHHSDEAKEKMRQAHLGEKNPMYDVPSPMKGRHLSDEAKEKMRQAHLGIKRSEETREKIRQGRLGRHHSDEAKEKMRQAQLGKKYTLGYYWWNNGVENKFNKECPGDGWVRGRLKK